MADTVFFTGINATTDAFELDNGLYGIAVHADNWNVGSVTLQIQAADGATWIKVGDSFSVDTYATINLPAAKYRLEIFGASGVSASIAKIF